MVSVESGDAVAQAGPQRSSTEAGREMEHSLANSQSCPTLEGQPTQVLSTSMPPKLRGDTDVNQWYGQLNNWFTSQRTMRTNVMPLVPAAWVPTHCHLSLDASSSDSHVDFDEKAVNGVHHDQASDATISTCEFSTGNSQRNLDSAAFEEEQCHGTFDAQALDATISTCEYFTGNSQCNLDSAAFEEEQCHGKVDASRSVKDLDSRPEDLVMDSHTQHVTMPLHRASRCVSEEARFQSAGAGASRDDIWRMLAGNDSHAPGPELGRSPMKKTTRLHAQERQRKAMGDKMRKCSDLSLALSWLENMVGQPINSIPRIAPPKQTHNPKKETAAVRLHIPEKMQDKHRPADSIGKTPVVNRVTCNVDANVKWTSSSVGQGFLR